MHHGRIGQLRLDGARSRVASISDDKTVRLFRVSDLGKLRTLPLPAHAGLEGTPYAVAWSVDDRHLFVAGFTGSTAPGGTRIYVVDVDTGRITGSIGRFGDATILALDVSPDGRRLAVGLGEGGLAVLDAGTGAVLKQDPQYAGPVRFVHHAPDGRLATVADDGCVRVYDDAVRLVYRRQYPPVPADQPQCTGGGMGGARFSPDGRWLAVGTTDRRVGDAWKPEVALYDARTLALRRVITVPTAGQRNLCCVAWSTDGATLFVNGSVETERPTPLYRIRDPATGTPEPVEVGRQTFTNMLPLPDGGLVFSTTVPSLVRLDAEGRVARSPEGRALVAEPGTVDFYRSRRDPTAFRVAADGRTVAFRLDDGRWLQASPVAADPLAALRIAASPDPALAPPRRAGPPAVVAPVPLPGEPATAPPSIAGRPVAGLLDGEVPASHALHPTRAVVALATQWRLLLLDDQARPLDGWREPPVIGAPAWHTAFSGDGRWVVVALADGSVRWFDVRTGSERLGLHVQADGTEWVAWRPDGFYASSPQGDRHLAWRIDRGTDTSPDLLRAVQFERTLYRPQALRDVFAPEGDASAASAPLPASALAAPRVRIESVSTATREVRFVVEPSPDGRPVTAIGVYANGLPVLPAEGRTGVPAGTAATRTVRIPDAMPFDQLRVEAETATAIGFDEAGATRIGPADTRVRGRLWVLAVGVGRFFAMAGCAAQGRCRTELDPLPAVSADARAVADGLRTAGQGLFSDVQVRVLATEGGGERPTADAVRRALGALRGARPEDTVVIFLGSHGLAGGSGAGEYFFVAEDAAPNAVERVLAGRPGPPPPGLVSATELVDALRTVPGRRLLILDTCHGGAAAGLSNPYALAKRSAAAQVAVLASSRGDERAFALATSAAPRGAFTEGLLRALDPGGARASDGPLTLAELHRAVLPVVAENVQRRNRQLQAISSALATESQTPVLVASEELQRMRLAADRGRGGSGDVR